MVCKKFLILDEGSEKYVPEGKMSKPKHVKDFEKILWDCHDAREQYDHYHYGVRNKYRTYDKAEDKILLDNVKKYDNDIVFLKTWGTEVQQKYWWDNKLCEYMNVIPFTPSVMINISPNWKGKSKMHHEYMIQLLENTIVTYLKASNRYDYYSYVIECGGDGDHIHCHIVAHINPDYNKSVITHINKGNHTVELRKIFSKCYKEKFSGLKPKGIEGVLQGKYAIQRILLRTQELAEDKLSYLVEENKPEGHKNAEHSICPKFVSITSK